ncbi:MAG TPA: transglutaminase domain-containing protein [bacterium]|nr:transglutaminase domain-containing protein [bacterium]
MRIKFVFKIFLVALLVQVILGFAQIPGEIQNLIDQGEFSRAQHLMRLKLATELEMDPLQRQLISFEIERLERIKKDFTRTADEILEYIQRYVPDATVDDLAQWEQEKSLEFWVIDGEKEYFKWAAPNLFRIDKELKKIKMEKDGPGKAPVYDRLADLRQIIQAANESGQRYVNPVRVKVSYRLAVNENVVPAGKVVRCWLPFPREIPNRQTHVKLLASEPARHIIADNDDYLQRTIYLEKPAANSSETEFRVEFEFISYAVYQKIDPQKIKPPVITAELAPFVAERPPHIVFSNDIKVLSKQIVGDETNPYFIARKIFKFINDNIPWASAREYSTFYNISDYVLRNMHCDCGMHSIFFMTLCRLNGIPTRWQSGWTTKPGGGGMHDWGEIYFEPYGWLPVDSDVGLINSSDEAEKWFFLGGMDGYRLIVNDDYSQSLYPAKIHHRSETIDFQRGEVEWEGGNLYFDQWSWDYQIEHLKP